MKLHHAAESLLAGAALLAFVASLAILNAVSVTVAHLGWAPLTAGGVALTALQAHAVSRLFRPAEPAPVRVDAGRPRFLHEARVSSR